MKKIKRPGGFLQLIGLNKSEISAWARKKTIVVCIPIDRYEYLLTDMYTYWQICIPIDRYEYLFTDIYIYTYWQIWIPIDRYIYTYWQIYIPIDRYVYLLTDTTELGEPCHFPTNTTTNAICPMYSQCTEVESGNMTTRNICVCNNGYYDTNSHLIGGECRGRL